MRILIALSKVDLEKKPENEALPTDGNLSSYGYCPICNDVGVSRERRPNGYDSCVKGHSYLSINALPHPLGGFCDECHTPSPQEENPSDEYVNKHSHPKFCIPR